MKGTKHIITPAQEAWLIEHYSDTKNADILEHLGWDANQGRSLRRIAALLGLQKSRDFMHQAQTNAMEHARIANQGEGNAGAKNLLLYGVAHRFKKGENNIQRIDAEREAARLKKSHDSRCETIRKERIRINWGFEQKTKMKFTREGAARTSVRHALKKRGYIVPHRGARTIYYDSQTRRSLQVEARATKRGFTIDKQN